MTNLSAALQQLREERKQAEVQIEKLDQAISVIEGLSGRSNSRKAASKAGGRSLSPAARRRISMAQRARWAQRRKQGGEQSSGGSKPVSAAKKRPLSSSARRRIAAAQRARWARFRAQQKAA
jgi:hypothetical protein